MVSWRKWGDRVSVEAAGQGPSWVFHVWRDKLSSITYSEALIFSMSDSLQSTDRPDGMVGQARCHVQRDA